LEVFLRLFSSHELLRRWWPKAEDGGLLPPFLLRIFSPLVVLWYMVFQRLHCDKSMEAVVTDVLNGGANALLEVVAREKRSHVLHPLKSRSTSAYSQARSALPAQVVQKASGFVAEQTARLNAAQTAALEPCEPPQPEDALLSLLDGSTMALRPFGDIAEVFGGPTNQNPRSYWCAMKVAACFNLQTGAVMAAACDAYATSEVRLSWRLMAQCAPGVIFVGDRGFGVYSVAERAQALGHEVILRLSEAQARRIAKKGGAKDADAMLEWAPSSHDQTPPESSRQPIKGRLIRVELERPGWRPIKLWLFTTLVDAKLWPASRVADCYGLRWNAEVDLRHLKSGLKLERLDVRSSQMALKEFHAGVLSYNLVRLFMQEEAGRAGVSARRLSFRSCQRVMESAFFPVDERSAGVGRRQAA
jgi:hypothetical protein